MKTNRIILTASMAVFTMACSEKKTEIANMNYPETKKVDTVDTYFGAQVADPYRWLENDTTKETGDWVKAQNDVTFGFLSKIPYRETVKKRLEEIFNYERLSAPFKEGDYFYFYKNDGLQNQSVLYRKKGENGKVEEFLNPNKFKEDGTISLAGVSFSKDGSLAAYQISKGGADWKEAIVLRTSDKTVVEDTIRNIKFGGIAWKGN
ncbi:MAG TPA: S9 family peptidase, partial [Chryseolinea sp.]|nr:S9 family peptidase [Chryseolinea sp.]